tara:strand:- start:398 stop:775 length:378 start_codon:yes stop_codon:yes gene_type:complete
MYSLTVNNNYIWQISANGGDVNIPERGGSHTFENQGNLFLNIPGMGQMAFIDLGDNKLPGYPEITETWGVLIRTHTTEAYYRYEGGGLLTLTVDQYGTGTLSAGRNTLVPISLEELNVEVTGLPD